MRRVLIDDIVPDTVLDEDVYGSANTAMPLLRKGSRITAIYLYKLKQRGVDSLYVKSLSFEREKRLSLYCQHVKKPL